MARGITIGRYMCIALPITLATQCRTQVLHCTRARKSPTGAFPVAEVFVRSTGIEAPGDSGSAAQLERQLNGGECRRVLPEKVSSLSRKSAKHLVTVAPPSNFSGSSMAASAACAFSYASSSVGAGGLPSPIAFTTCAREARGAACQGDLSHTGFWVRLRHCSHKPCCNVTAACRASTTSSCCQMRQCCLTARCTGRSRTRVKDRICCHNGKGAHLGA